MRDGDYVNRAIKMMIGMGMPRNSKSRDRMVASLGLWENRIQASRRRPPNVAARLATNAPTSSETNSQSAL